MEKYLFQYCPKLAVFSQDEKKILLCRRKGELDYDGVFSFIGGKMEITDKTLIEAIQREKNEEVGKDFKVLLYPHFCYPVLFRKKDGNAMIVPHYFARHKKGDIILSDEYSEYTWVSISGLDLFGPKISNIPYITGQLVALKKIMKQREFVMI